MGDKGAPGRARDGAAPAIEHGRLIATLIAAGLALLAIGVVATLSHAAARRSGTNGMELAEVFGSTGGGGTFCQHYEQIPADTGAVQVSLFGIRGRHAPTIGVVLADRRGRIASGRRPAGHLGPTELPVVPLRTTVAHDAIGHVCVTLGGGGHVGIVGQATASRYAAKSGGEPLPGRLRIVYLRPGRESWWALASTVAHRIAINHPLPGGPAALLAALLTVVSILIGTWQLARRAA